MTQTNKLDTPQVAQPLEKVEAGGGGLRITKTNWVPSAGYNERKTRIQAEKEKQLLIEKKILEADPVNQRLTKLEAQIELLQQMVVQIQQEVKSNG